MFSRLSNSWQLVKASLEVLRTDKVLMVFPALSGTMLVLVTLAFALPAVFANLFDSGRSGPAGFVVGFAFYLVAYFVIFFCNSALVGAALIRLRGGDATVGDGFRIAFGKFGSILGYALVAATVGVILRNIQQRAGFIGRILVGILGVAWSIATFLVVPVLVAEDVGPFDAVKRSTELLKKTWGEQLIGNFGVGTVTGLAGFFLSLLFIPAIGLAVASQTPALIIATIGGYVLCLILLALIHATLAGIYTAAVYRYATDGEMGSGFRPEMLQGAFRQKGS